MKKISKYIFGVCLLLILSSGIAMLIGHLGVALKILIAVFLFFSLGVFFYLIELKHES